MFVPSLILQWLIGVLVLVWRIRLPCQFISDVDRSKSLVDLIKRDFTGPLFRRNTRTHDIITSVCGSGVCRSLSLNFLAQTKFARCKFYLLFCGGN